MGLGTAALPYHSPEQAVNIIRQAIDQGVNYLDLGYAFDLKEQEKRVKIIVQALNLGYREKVKLALNFPPFQLQNTLDLERFLHWHLDWLQTSKIDYFLLGWLDQLTWPRMQKLGVLQQAESRLSQGAIQHLGFSFHDDYQALRTILNEYSNWELAEFQYSYMDFEHHPGAGGIHLAAEKGLTIVASEPFKKGRLLNHIPPGVQSVWDGDQEKRTPEELAMNWLWNQPEISTVAVDVNSIEQLKALISLSEKAEAGMLSIQDEVLISQAADSYRSLRTVNCTTCRSCLPCPQNIDIPRVFELHNDAVMFGEAQIPRFSFKFEKLSVDQCNQCGICVKRCGRGIDIPAQLKAAGHFLADV